MSGDLCHLPTGITLDNTHLSKATQGRALAAEFAVDCKYPEADAKVLEFLQAAHADNTRRAYKSDVEHFIAWGGGLPATEKMIARYLADHAGRLAVATLARRLVAIRSAHVARGLRDPTKSELVRLTFRGIRRKLRRPQRQAAALSIEDLRVIISSLGSSPKEVRDAAILLVGFAGGFRRSELVSLDCNDIEMTAGGLRIRIRRSKTDQEGHGRRVIIPHGEGLLCPVAVLERWLMVAQITRGPLFRPVTKTGIVLRGRLSGEAVATAIKQHVYAIGRDPALYSGHSLRAGFITSATMARLPNWKIRAQTGHGSDAVLERYIREGERLASDDFNAVLGPRPL